MGSPMAFSPLAFFELFVVLAFLVAWGVLELVASRLDARRRQADRSEDQLVQSRDVTRDERTGENTDKERL